MKTKRKITPRLPVRIVSGLPPEEHLFCLLVGVLGYSTSKAYHIAISSNVQANSAAAMGCRLLSEKRIQDHLHLLMMWQKDFIFNDQTLKYQ